MGFQDFAGLMAFIGAVTILAEAPDFKMMALGFAYMIPAAFVL